MRNAKVHMTYQIISDVLSVMTVAFFVKNSKSDWDCFLIAAGESYEMLHRLEGFHL